MLVLILSTFISKNTYAKETQTELSLETVGDNDQVLRLQPVTLALNALDIDDLYTMQIELRYDHDRLMLKQDEFQNHSWRNKQNGYTAIQADLNTGKVKIINSQKGKTSGFDGDVQIINIPFTAVRIGSTTIEIIDVKLMDSQGNRINTGTSSISKTINILPNPLNVKITGEMGQSGWYISPVTVEIQDLDASKIQYTLNGTIYNYIEPFVFDEIGQNSLAISTNDGYGYLKSKELNLKIDYEAPIISIDNQDQDWKNVDLTFIPQINDNNGSGVSEVLYQWMDNDELPEQWELYKGDVLTRTEEGNWYLHIKASDEAGNESQVVSGPYRIDKTKPVISIDTEAREEWDNSDVIVTPVIIDEGGSQIKNMKYQWSHEQADPLAFIPYETGDLMQTDDGVWYLHLVAEDNAGNITTKMYGPYRVDKSAPVITINGVTEGMDYTDTVTPIIYIDDAVSGIKFKKLLLNGQAYESGTLITQQGSHTINVSAEDLSGNISDKSITFFIYASTKVTLTVTQAEYSDPYTVNISLSSNSVAVSGAAITIRMSGNDLGTYNTDEHGNITLSRIAEYGAGHYSVEAIYNQDNISYYRPAQSQSSLVVYKEKASLNYTGSYEVLYPGTMRISALVLQEDDGHPGDLCLARIKVDITRFNPDGTSEYVDSFITGCNSDGTVTYEHSYGLGAYAVTLSLEDDGYYTPGYLYRIVPVYHEGNGAVSCGGWILLPDPSTGEMVKVTCNFNIKYKKDGADGKFKLFYDEAGININDGNIKWLIINGNTAQFEGTDGNYTYRIGCTDNGKDDYLTIRIWKGFDTLSVPTLEFIQLEQGNGNINVKDR